MKVALPRYGESIAPRFGSSATITIFTIERSKVVEQFDFSFRSREPLDRIRLLKDQGVDTLICGGVRRPFEDMLTASGIQVISWVSGNVEDLLQLFLRDQLVAGTARPVET